MSRGGRNKGHRKLTCKRGHPLSGENLYVSPGGTRQCRACVRKTHSTYRKTLKGKLAAKARDIREVGWTLERYRSVLLAQNSACAICKIPFANFPKSPFCDHNHATQTPRGLLCSQCNAGLGMFKDNPVLLELAATYLRVYMNNTKWSDIVDGYIREERPVSGGCGPSSALKAINASVQDFAGKVKDEAGDIFGDASQVFNTVMNSVKGIVAGGPSQFGYSAGEYNAKTAAAVNAGAAEARNLKGAAASSAAAIGGGNVATPAGITQATVLSADQKAAADTAAAKNEIVQEGYAKGYDEWKTGLDATEKAPGVFSTANQANEVVSNAQHEAETSQQNIDTQSNWAMNDVMKLGTAAVSGWASGGFKLPGMGGSKAASST